MSPTPLRLPVCASPELHLYMLGAIVMIQVMDDDEMFWLPGVVSARLYNGFVHVWTTARVNLELLVVTVIVYACHQFI